MYDKNDPRAALGTAKAAKSAIQHDWFFGSQLGLFYDRPPEIDAEGERTWITRGQNFLVLYSECEPGYRLIRTGQIDEYAVLLPEADTAARITSGGQTEEMPGFSLAFVPPGDSTVEITRGGPVVRLITPLSDDLAALASNAAEYAAPHPNVPPFTAWPDPVGGYKIRVYSLDVPQEPGRFGRIFRCTTFMVNVLETRVGPRAKTAVSPHHHDDFEQVSLALSGSFTHHLRWPWTTDMTKWKEDEHIFVNSPSICVIPPPSIHTSTAEGEGVNQLVDIFSPPRMDFSRKPGWVLNADDYPMPDA